MARVSHEEAPEVGDPAIKLHPSFYRCNALSEIPFNSMNLLGLAGRTPEVVLQQTIAFEITPLRNGFSRNF